MSTPTFRNYIAGEWIAGATTTLNRNPSDLSDVIGEYAQADAAQARTAIASAKQAFPGWAHGGIQERANILDRAGSEIIARKDELGRLLSREEGKTLPEGVGEAMRAGNIFKFFAGGSAARVRREAAVGAARRRRRGHARAARRHRPHHAVEFPDRDPGVEDRAGAGLRQHRRDEARRPRPRLRVGDRRNPGQGRVAGRRLQSGDGARIGRRRGARHASGRRGHQLHRFGRDRAAASRRRPSRGWRRSSSRWAARIRSSSSTTPTSRLPSTARCRAPTSRPGSAAPRRRG